MNASSYPVCAVARTQSCVSSRCSSTDASRTEYGDIEPTLLTTAATRYLGSRRASATGHFPRNRKQALHSGLVLPQERTHGGLTRPSLSVSSVARTLLAL